MIDWQRVRDVLTDKVVIGTASNEVGRIFVRCYDCRRVVPAWNLLKQKGDGGRSGCKCGSNQVKPRNIGKPLGYWWYFVRGILIRKLILRKSNYDPRIPYRQGHVGA